MKKTFDGRWKEIRWGVVTSVVLHLAVVAFFVVKLPEQPPKPPEEEAVKVEMVPPPEETKPEEPKPEEKKAEAKKPEEKKPEEKPPELPKIEEKAEQKPPAPPPAPPPPAPAPPPPAPAPPPPPPPPEAKPEEKPPEEKPAEPPKSEAQNDPTDKQGKGQSMPVLRPVFEFGDKDSGPRKSEMGDASQEAAKPPVTPPDEAKRDDPKPEEAKPEDPKAVEAASGKPPVTDAPPANPVPDDVALPQVDMANINPAKNGPAAGAEEDAKTDFTPPKPAEKPKTDQTETAKTEAPGDLKEAKTLFSQSDTGDSVARTAIGNMPRSRRASQLCSTELRQQLIHGSPAYNPVIVPAYGLPRGTVLDVKRGAFRTREGWYDVQFRCEVDQDVTKIQSFAVSVGDAIPQSQWRSRGFPEF